MCFATAQPMKARRPESGRTPAPWAPGVTLVEVLIVVLVLTLLTVIVAPQFSRAESDARFSALKANLLDIRAQLRLYRTQHGDVYPEMGRFAEQMTSFTSAGGQTSPRRTEEHHLGPYLRSIPCNPYTGGNAIGSGPAGTSDWFYNPVSGLFRANHHPAFFAY